MLTPPESPPEPPATYRVSPKERTAWAAFCRFWAAYPEGRKVAKKAAWKAWRKVGFEDRERAIQCIGEGKQYAGFETRYVPYPATYLNQERWEDYWQCRPEVETPIGNREREPTDDEKRHINRAWKLRNRQPPYPEVE